MRIRQVEGFPQQAPDRVPVLSAVGIMVLVILHGVHLWAHAVRGSTAVVDLLGLGGPGAHLHDVWRPCTAFFIEPTLPGLLAALLALWCIARELERHLGPGRLLALWLLGAVCTMLGHGLGDLWLLERTSARYLGAMPPLVVLCAAYLRRWGAQEVYPALFLQMKGRNLALLIAVLLVAAYDFRTLPVWGVREEVPLSVLGPLTGCVGGATVVLLGPVFGRRLTLLRAYREVRRLQHQAARQEEVDRLLAKVTAGGLGSLTRRELRLLRRRARHLRGVAASVDELVERQVRGTMEEES